MTKGGPAEAAGIVTGDIIIAVDGVSIAGDQRQNGSELISGEEGSAVTLTILREDGATPGRELYPGQPSEPFRSRTDVGG